MIDWNNVFELMISNLPTLSVVLVGILTGIQKIGNTAKKYPNITSALKAEMTSQISNQQKALEEMTLSFLNKTESVVDNALKGIADTRGEFIKVIEQFSTMQLQVNALIKQNKASFEVISALVSKDATFIKSNVASMVVDISNKSKKEIEKISKEVSSDYNVLRQSVTELFTIVGETNFKKILEEIGYEKDKTSETKELQTKSESV